MGTFKAYHARRLLKLANVLDDVPDNRFDMSTWGTPDFLEKPACGTSACALGWATTIPSLRDKRRCGLRLECNTAGDEGYVTGNVEGGRNRDSFAVAAHTFGLDPRTAEKLFTGYSTPRLKAAQIRRLVKKLCSENGIKVNQ